jgi:hypothetical protein
MVDRKKRGRGRSAAGRDPAISTRLPEPLMQAVLQWAADQNLTRAEAIRRLVEHALTYPPKSRR